MRLIPVAVVAAAMFLLGAAGAVAGGPPVVNETDHPIDAPFTEIGVDCGTGLPTLINGTYSGVLHTVVLADGSTHFTGSARGSLTEDDLPVDGTIDATETFTLHLDDQILPPGSEVTHASLSGTGTTDTGATFRIHEVVQIVLDNTGSPKLVFQRLTCS